jgi:hypothetical protein
MMQNLATIFWLVERKCLTANIPKPFLNTGKCNLRRKNLTPEVDCWQTNEINKKLKKMRPNAYPQDYLEQIVIIQAIKLLFL